MKIILFERTQTQRVVVNLEPNKESVLISKEWRKTTDEDWRIGKSIEIPSSELKRTSELLEVLNRNRDDLCGSYLDGINSHTVVDEPNNYFYKEEGDDNRRANTRSC